MRAPRSWPALLGGLALIAATGGSAEDLRPAESRGRQLYREGTSPNGRAITAVVGQDVEVAAASLPCGGCHGEDGRGVREGGIAPPDLTWDALAHPAAALGRTRPAYDEPLLKRAFTFGIDAGGQPLQVAMPRYRLRQEEAADLVAYLRRLGHDLDPGLSAAAIRIGVLLPPDGSATGSLAEPLRQALSAFVAEINRGGGIYDRRLDLRFAAMAVESPSRAVQLSGIIGGEPVFALATTFLSGAETEMTSALGVARLPTVGGITSLPPPAAPLNRYVFYLSGSLLDQVRALVTFAAGELANRSRRLAVLVPAGAEQREVVGAALDEAHRQAWRDVLVVAVPPDPLDAARVAGKLAAQGVDGLLLLDTGPAARALLAEVRRLGWRPLLLLPGGLASEDLLASLVETEGAAFAAFPSLPAERFPGGAYRRLAATYALPALHQTQQVSALAAAALLVEGLRRVGHDLSREKLVTALEGLYRFETGFGPAVTYGPNRRVGAPGAYIVPLDAARRAIGPAVRWIEVEP